MDKAVDEKIKPVPPFARAYNFLLKDKNLTSAEKLVMIVVCRYWPNPYWAANKQIAEDLGFTERYVEKIVKSLEDKGYIKRGYAHTTKNARPHTVRVIAPKCFPVKSNAKIKWVKPPEHMDGQHTEDMDGNSPNNSSFLPEQPDDLLDRNKKGIKKQCFRHRLSKGRLQHCLKSPKPGTQREFEQRRQKMIRDLQKKRKNNKIMLYIR